MSLQLASPSTESKAIRIPLVVRIVFLRGTLIMDSQIDHRFRILQQTLRFSPPAEIDTPQSKTASKPAHSRLS
jgi:hypothetical protein